MSRSFSEHYREPTSAHVLLVLALDHRSECALRFLLEAFAERLSWSAAFIIIHRDLLPSSNPFAVYHVKTRAYDNRNPNET